MNTTVKQTPIWKLTDELYDWMYTVCKNYNPKSVLADVYVYNGWLTAADGYRLYRVPVTLASKDDWLSKWSGQFENPASVNDSDFDGSRWPCARSSISSGKYPRLSKILEQGFLPIGRVTTGDLLAQCHEVFAAGVDEDAAYIMPIKDTGRSVRAQYVFDMLSLPHLLGSEIEIAAVKGMGVIRFRFECGIEVFIMPYWISSNADNDSYIGKTAREAIIKALEYNPPGWAESE